MVYDYDDYVPRFSSAYKYQQLDMRLAEEFGFWDITPDLNRDCANSRVTENKEIAKKARTFVRNKPAKVVYMDFSSIEAKAVGMSEARKEKIKREYDKKLKEKADMKKLMAAM